MSRQVIESGGVPVGIAISEGNSHRFLAVKFNVFDLDGRVFGSIGDLRLAVRRQTLNSAYLAA